MKKFLSMTRQFRDDEDGAAMIEYSIMVGIIAAASILVIIGLGLWVSGTFTNLCTTLNGKGGVACDALGGTGSSG